MSGTALLTGTLTAHDYYLATQQLAAAAEQVSIHTITIVTCQMLPLIYLRLMMWFSPCTGTFATH
jgi:hypothetical protein